MPWIIITLIVIASLWWKGYVKLPARSTTFTPTVGPVAILKDAGVVAIDASTGNWAKAGADAIPAIRDIATYTSHELGVLFARAKMTEAHLELANTIAKQAGDTITATFQAPFVPPVPVGQAPSQTGPKLSP